MFNQSFEKCIGQIISPQNGSKSNSSLSVSSRLVEMFQDLIVSYLLFAHSFRIFSVWQAPQRQRQVTAPGFQFRDEQGLQITMYRIVLRFAWLLCSCRTTM